MGGTGGDWAPAYKCHGRFEPSTHSPSATVHDTYGYRNNIRIAMLFVLFEHCRRLGYFISLRDGILAREKKNVGTYGEFFAFRARKKKYIYIHNNNSITARFLNPKQYDFSYKYRRISQRIYTSRPQRLNLIYAPYAWMFYVLFIYFYFFVFFYTS